MTISVLQETEFFQAGSSATIAKVFAGSVTAGSSIHVAIRCSASGVTYTCSDNVNGSYGSPLNTFTDSGGGHASAHFQFSNSGSGTITVTVTPNSSQPSMFIGIREIGGCSGFDVAIAHDNNGVGTGTDAVTSNTSTPSVQPGLLSAFVMRLVGTGNPAVGTGFTGGQTSDPGLQTEHLRYTSTATRAATATNTVGGDDVAIAAAWFKETGALGGSGSQMLYGVGK